jgi:hypothetical protein
MVSEQEPVNPFEDRGGVGAEGLRYVRAFLPSEARAAPDCS